MYVYICVCDEAEKILTKIRRSHKSLLIAEKFFRCCMMHEIYNGCLAAAWVVVVVVVARLHMSLLLLYYLFFYLFFFISYAWFAVKWQHSSV